MMTMFVRSKTHRQHVARLESEIAGLMQSLEKEKARAERIAGRLEVAACERDEARAELAPLKAARDRANANLVAANARRRAGAQKERA
jgi:peptidoglycan hydrolase CwlO-like protein